MFSRDDRFEDVMGRAKLCCLRKSKTKMQAKGRGGRRHEWVGRTRHRKPGAGLRGTLLERERRPSPRPSEPSSIIDEEILFLKSL